jgi:hypothetical protein
MQTGLVLIHLYCTCICPAYLQDRCKNVACKRKVQVKEYPDKRPVIKDNDGFAYQYPSEGYPK